jgi:hypothetical protein
MSHNTSEIRQFILKTFDDQEFHDFCFDYFPDVYSDLTIGMRMRQMVQLLLAYCNRYGQTASLLAALQRERSTLYQKEFALVPPVEQLVPRQQNPRQVFISHASADAEIAYQLAADLETAGWSVWIAPKSILPGEKWVEAINRGLEESAVFVLLMTPEAVQSRWVTSETNVAIEMEHEGLLRFIPIQIKFCSLPALWRAYQRISFRSGYEVGWPVLLERLNSASEDSWPGLEVLGPELEAESPQSNIYFHDRSSLEFVRIPAGDFMYGEEKMVIFLPEFWIAKTLVTNAHYARFVEETGYPVPQHWQDRYTYPDGMDNYPVVYVNWSDVTAYCEWAGGRLPAEEEWEKAARGTDGRLYPWGNKWISNFCNSEEMTLRGPNPVGQFSPQGDSPYGCVDMSGNVWEWTDSWHDPEQRYRELRGGAYWNNRYQVMCTSRYWGSPSRYFCDYRGFRICLAPFFVPGS